MIDVGIAGTIGLLLGWLCALLFLVVAISSGRVAFALAVRGARRGGVRVMTLSLLVLAGLGVGVAHFATAPRHLTVDVEGDWSIVSLYGLEVDRVPAGEVREARLTADGHDVRLEVRRESGQILTLRGDVRGQLGYRLDRCGAWRDRPVWSPHTVDAIGPVCGDDPWPARRPGPLARNSIR